MWDTIKISTKSKRKLSFQIEDPSDLTTMKVWRKWLLMQAGEKLVSPASRNTTHTMSFPMCRFRWSCF